MDNPTNWRQGSLIKTELTNMVKAQRAADYAAVEKVLLEQLDGAGLVLNLIRPIYEQDYLGALPPAKEGTK